MAFIAGVKANFARCFSRALMGRIRSPKLCGRGKKNSKRSERNSLTFSRHVCDGGGLYGVEANAGRRDCVFQETGIVGAKFGFGGGNREVVISEASEES